MIFFANLRERFVAHRKWMAKYEKEEAKRRAKKEANEEKIPGKAQILSLFWYFIFVFFDLIT